MTSEARSGSSSESSRKPSGDASSEAGREARALTSTTPRLSRGDIPAAWTQPAEVLSAAPSHAPRPLASSAVVLASIAACVVLAIALSRRNQPTAPPDPPAAEMPTPDAPPAALNAPSTATPSPPSPSAERSTPRPIDEVPEPTPTASSIPTGVAPEDQGGAERPSVEAPPAPKSDDRAPVVEELPARKKARGYVTRGEQLLLDGDAKGAEPLLRRAAALDPTYADAWRNLGIARATLGDTKGARIAYKLYLKAAPDAPDAAEVRKILSAAPEPPPAPAQP